MDAQGRIELGGRHFIPVGESTMEHDLRFSACLARAGIDKIVQREDEPVDAFARRLLDTLLAGEEVLEMLGCLMIPEADVPEGQLPGDVWTPELAEQTKTFLGQVKGTEKEIIHSLVLSLLISLFERGIVSLWSSRMSSIGTVPSASSLSAAALRETEGMTVEQLAKRKEKADVFKQWAGSATGAGPH